LHHRRWQRSETMTVRQSSSGITLRGIQMCYGTTHSATCIWIRIQVAKWVVPQYVRTPPNELRNHPFRNVYTDPYTHCGMGDSVTHWEVSERIAEPPIPQLVYGSIYMLRNGWFRNKNSSKISHPQITDPMKSPQIHYKSYNR